MLFNFATLTLPLVLLGRIAIATPVDSRAAESVGVTAVKANIDHPPNAVPAVAHSPKAAVPSVEKSHTGVSANTGFQSLTNTVDEIVVCSGTGCSGTCYGYSIDSMAFKTCYAANIYFYSAYIYQASNAGYPFGVYVATPTCESGEQLPNVNTCYNTNGPMVDFMKA
jgi:hypothetical protein